MPGLYLSAAHRDQPLADRLRAAFARREVPCAADDHRMGDRAALPPAIITALDDAAGLVVLASPAGCASAQVAAEVQHVTDRGHADAIAVIAHGLTAAELNESWPALAALGCHPLPDHPTDAELDEAAYRAVAAARIGPRAQDEIVIDFDRFRIEAERVCARVCVDGHIGEFRAPLGPIEAEELRWYLESYHRWPAHEFERRAAGIVDQLPGWGLALWHALLTAAGPALGDPLNETGHTRRLLTLRMATPRPVPLDAARAAEIAGSVGGGEATRQLILARVAATRQGLITDDRPPEVLAAHRAENEAQSRLLALPWEMLRPAGQYLFNRAPPIALRRVLVPREPRAPLPERHGPIRVLVVVARPEKAGLIDPRASADALIDAVAPLGEAVRLDFLRPPTLAALAAALGAADYDVLHFDGHGVYDRATGLGYLCFEHRDPTERAAGETELIDGAALRDALGDKRLPLAFLEACQTGQSDDTTDAAVASALLAAGAESVIAMSHSVLVTTAARFTAAFYRALTEGHSVAQATARARKVLAADPNRGAGEDPGRLKLRDWHVPLLYQREGDPVPVPDGAARQAGGGVDLRAMRHATLPLLHGHGFVGRLGERLSLERALEDHRVALIVGMGGQGKTTLAAELGRWLVRCERFRAAAFVSVEQASEVEGVLSAIGRALIGPGFVVEGVGDAAIATATAAIGDWMARHAGLVIIDNFETLLPPPKETPAAEASTHRPELLAAMLDLMWALCRRGDSRLIVTCREPLDDPRFKRGRTCHVAALGGLAERAAVALVGEICLNDGVLVDPGDDRALEAMVRAVGCHPRSLVLLPPLLRHHGVRAVTDDLHGLMAELEARHPGERERSLLASVKLSLRRLEPQWREVLPPLGLLRAGVSAHALCELLEWELPQVGALCDALAARGLGHRELGGNYLRFHPALAAVLEAELRATRAPAAVDAAWDHTVAVYRGLVGGLYRMQFGPQVAVATGLAARELPNLLRVLAHLASPPGDGPDRTDVAINYATLLEGLLQETPYRRALAGVAKTRAALADRSIAGGWSHARYIAADAAIDRLLDAGRLAEALPAAEAAEAQARRAAAAGAFPEAAYDHAQALWSLGRVRQMADQPQPALAAIERARRGFDGLPGDYAARMASACLTEGADCLTAMGRYDAAATRYEQAVKVDRARGDTRDVAVGLGQLATARMMQGDLAAALTGWQKARSAFEALGEPAAVATAWHQIGRVLETAERFAEAEDAYKRSVALKLERGARLAAAGTMNQLAIVARRAGRPEDAVAWHRRALAIFTEVGDAAAEGRSRNNLANALRQTGRLAEAEAEARAAAKIRDAQGIAAQPWKTWDILYDIACARNDPAGAAEARGHAIDWYRRYRAQGGAPAPQVMRPYAMARDAVANGAGPALADQIDAAIAARQLPETDWPTWRALAAFARGAHAAVRAALDTLDYEHVVELELLLAGRWPDPTAGEAPDP